MARDCVKRISRYPHQQEGEYRPRAYEQEHEIPLDKEMEYTSSHNQSLHTKKRGHKPQGRTTSIRIRAQRAPASKGSHKGVKCGFCDSKTHYVKRCSEKKEYRKRSEEVEGIEGEEKFTQFISNFRRLENKRPVLRKNLEKFENGPDSRMTSEHRDNWKD